MNEGKINSVYGMSKYTYADTDSIKCFRYLIKTISNYYNFEGEGIKFLENESQIIIREKDGSETIFMKCNVIYAAKIAIH